MTTEKEELNVPPTHTQKYLGDSRKVVTKQAQIPCSLILLARRERENQSSFSFLESVQN